ncbi:tetratricopeptide repeat protein [Risungbinella massiliensis]|uniref:tetratricopeptide repeat protein n=1 Tax=Risungbinella massiliensis TaxID=1329796 RepID=UPI0005CBB602|nr:tetratricopeptide repeat protein [Risungbinella massiliensis]
MLYQKIKRKWTDMKDKRDKENPKVLFQEGFHLIFEKELNSPEEIDRGYALLQKAAELGHAEAMFWYGSGLERGYKTVQDIQSGVEWLKKSQSLGNKMAKQALVYHYLEQGDSQGVKWALELIEDGNEDLAIKLGEYWFAYHFEEKSDEIIRLLTPLVKKENLEALHLMGGVLLEKGDISGKDLLERSAVLGNTHSMYSLGYLYLTGDKGFSDQAKAHEYLRQAVEAQHVDAMFLYANLLMHEMTEQSTEEALTLLHQAAIHGHPMSMLHLAKRLLHERYPEEVQDEGVRWLIKAAESNFSEAMYELAKLYRDHPRYQNPEKYHHWFKKAMQIGQAEDAPWIQEALQNLTSPR